MTAALALPRVAHAVRVHVRLSPSRVEKFNLCPARWGYAELPGGVAEPNTPATDYGTATHLEHELRWRDGKAYDTSTPEGRTAAAMARYLPKALPPYGAPELELRYAVDGLELVGRLDLTWPYHDHKHGGRLTVCVTDYKTCGGFRYAKLERDALLGHPQAPFYALLAMRHFGTEHAFLHWIYGERDDMVPRPVLGVQCSDHYIDRDEATERVHLRMLPAAKQMQAYADAGLTADDAHTLPKNLRACRAFNRLCPFYLKCQPTKEQDMSEANDFLAAMGLSAVGTPPAAPTKTVADNVQPVVTPPVADKPGDTQPVVPIDTKPAINPPEQATGAGKGKGKGAAKSGDGPRMTEDEIGALADAIIDRLALRLVRNVK